MVPSTEAVRLGDLNTIFTIFVIQFHKKKNNVKVKRHFQGALKNGILCLILYLDISENPHISIYLKCSISPYILYQIRYCDIVGHLKSRKGYLTLGNGYLTLGSSSLSKLRNNYPWMVIWNWGTAIRNNEMILDKRIPRF